MQGYAYRKNNLKTKYELDGANLDEVIEERDLGVIIQNDLKCSQQCSKAIKTANRILCIIKRTFTYLDSENVLQLYKTLVRPHLEYSVQAWIPYYRKYIDLIEKVQRRATKLIPSLKNTSYQDRLTFLDLTTLETRRGDLIEVLKIFKGYDDLKPSNFFNLNSTVTRDHS